MGQQGDAPPFERGAQSVIAQQSTLTIADPPERWAALGFDVDAGNLDVGGVRIRLGEPGRGITSWSLRKVSVLGTLDGLPTPVPTVLRPPPFATHPNGATGLDHVVVITPDRRIATLRDSAGLTPAVAFMTPDRA